MSDIAKEIEDGNNISASVIKWLPKTIEGFKEINSELEKEKAKIDEEILDNVEKIRMMEKHNLNEYDEDFFKVMKALDAIDSSKSKEEKAKILTKLLKN